MEKISTFALLCLLASLTGVQAATDTALSAPEVPAIWTAERAVAVALAGNPDSTIAAKRIEEAAAAAAMAKASDYPLINLAGEYGQTNNPMYSFGNILNQGAFDNTIDFNNPGRTDNLQVKAMIQYRLYNGGRDQADRAAATAHLDTARTDLVAVHHQLGFEVVRTFQAIIQAEKMVTVRDEELAAITAALEVARARYEAGDLLRQDLLNLELQQSRASENLIQSKHALELTKRGFLNLLGLRQGEVAVDPDSGQGQQLPPDIGYQNRHELTRLESQIQAAEAELRKAAGGNLPTVDTFASYQVDGGLVLEEAGDSWMAGIKMNYNLFDGHRTTAEITRARLKLQELQAVKIKTELALNLEVQQALLDYEQAKERLGVTAKMVGAAEEVARLSRLRFKEGVILASDLIDFEMRLTDARARQLAARAGYQVAIANLRRATGLAQFSGQE